MNTFKSGGLAQTRQRDLVYKALRALDRPVSAGELKAFLSEKPVNLSTVYRILSVFERRGLVSRISAPDGARSLYYLNKKGHVHHVICSRCNASVEVRGCPFEEFSKRINADTGYTILDHRLEFAALCPDCLGKKARV